MPWYFLCLSLTPSSFFSFQCCPIPISFFIVFLVQIVSHLSTWLQAARRYLIFENHSAPSDVYWQCSGSSWWTYCNHFCSIWLYLGVFEQHFVSGTSHISHHHPQAFSAALQGMPIPQLSHFDPCELLMKGVSPTGSQPWWMGDGNQCWNSFQVLSQCVFHGSLASHPNYWAPVACNSVWSVLFQH